MYWYEKLNKNFWSKQETFGEHENIPNIKNFLLGLYVSDEMYEKKFQERVNKLLKKIDTIVRKELEDNSISEHEFKDIHDLIGNSIKFYCEIYHKEKLTEKQKEKFIAEIVYYIAKGIKNTYSNNMRTKKRQEAMKKEEEILSNLGYPVKLKCFGEIYEFQNREELDKNIFYFGNYNNIQEIQKRSKQGEKIPNLLLSEVIKE